MAGRDGSTGTMDLQGWDTVSAVTLEAMNAAIVAQKLTPAKFQIDGSGLKLEGDWADWGLIPAAASSGTDAMLSCPIKGGTVTDRQGKAYPFKDTTVIINVSFKIVEAAAGSVSDPTAKAGSTGDPKAVTIDAEGTAISDAVTVERVVNAPAGTNGEVLKYIFAAWFNANIRQFDPIFLRALLNVEADKDGFQWLKPTALDFASVSTTDGHGVFGALCMTEGRKTDDNAPQIPDAAATGFPAGANAVFIISRERFASQVLLPGAVLLMDGAKVEDFEITDDGGTVTNKVALPWRDLKLENGEIVNTSLAPGGIRLGVDGDAMTLEFSNLTFKNPLLVGNDVVSISFSQKTYLEVIRNAHGAPILAVSNRPRGTGGRDVPSIESYHIYVRPDAAAREFERIMNIVSLGAAILGLVTWGAGMVIKLASSAADAAKPAVNAIVDGSEAAATVAIDADDALVSADAATAAADEADAVTATTSNGPVAARAVPYLFKFSKILGLTATVTGVASLIVKAGEIVDQDAYGDQTKNKTMELFVANALGSHAWPETKGWTLVDADLNEALVLYGKLETG